MQLSIITPTWKRPSHLYRTCRQVLEQKTKIDFEHVIISDGPDPWARRVVGYFGKFCWELREHEENNWGQRCRDKGTEVANGDYVCFWDDDNDYYRNSVQLHWESTLEGTVDVGICQVLHRERVERHRPGFYLLPEKYEGANIDTLCICVKKELAASVKFSDHKGRDQDRVWFGKIIATNPSVNFLAKPVGVHL